MAASRVMRLVVLLVFIGWLLSDVDTIRGIFAGVCAVFVGLTLWQLWTTYKDAR